MVDSDDNALGDIVMIPPVLAARERGVLQSLPMPEGPTRDGICWPDHEPCADVIVWATGFRPALAHLRPLRLREPDGDWTGPGIGDPHRCRAVDRRSSRRKPRSSCGAAVSQVVSEGGLEPPRPLIGH